MMKYFAQVFLAFCLFHIGEESLIFAPVDCPSDCSGHGKCESINGTDTCVCEDDWGGVSCAYRNFDLPSDHPLSVTVDKDEYFYFRITIKDPPTKNFTIIVLGFTTDTKAKGPALYLANGYYPTDTHYKVMNDSFALRKNLTVLNPESGEWRLAVRGQDPTPLILTVQANLDDKCTNRCSRRGRCMSHIDGVFQCICPEYFRGDYCQTHTRAMESTTLYSGFVQSGFWNNWHYDVPLGGVVTGSELVLSISSSEEGGTPPELYVQCSNGRLIEESDMSCMNTWVSMKSTLPSNGGYSPVKMRSCRIAVEDEPGRPRRWFIEVRGGSNNSGPYVISAELRGHSDHLLMKNGQL